MPEALTMSPRILCRFIVVPHARGPYLYLPGGGTHRLGGLADLPGNGTRHPGVFKRTHWPRLQAEVNDLFWIIEEKGVCPMNGSKGSQRFLSISEGSSWKTGGTATNGVDASEIFGFDLEEMNARHHLTFDTYEQGKLSLDEYLNRTIFYEKRPFSKEEVKAFMFKTGAYPQMIDLFRNLKKGCGIKMAVVSNEGRELTIQRISEYDLNEFIYFFICSCFVHLRKPDEEIPPSSRRGQVNPAEGSLIDDRKMFVEVAKNLGINGVHHTGYASTTGLLTSYGLMGGVSQG